MTAERRAGIAFVAVAGVFFAAALVSAPPSWHRPVVAGRAGATVAAPAATTRMPEPAQPLSANRALYLALSEPLGAIADSDRIVDQNSVELASLVQPAKLSSARGRAELRELLSRAEEVADLRLEISEQNLRRIRDAAQRAPVDPRVTSSFVVELDAQAERTRAVSEQLFETQRQAVVAGRRLLAFMEDSRAAYEVAAGSVSFRSAALQVQFNHFLSQTGQILKREHAVRTQEIAARRAQERLLYALNEGG